MIGDCGIFLKKSINGDFYILSFEMDSFRGNHCAIYRCSTTLICVV